MSFEQFHQAYLDAIEFTDASIEGEDEAAGADWSDQMLAQCRADCAAFYEGNAALWADLSDYDDAQAGHDFWLTRNHHGAGFWDRAPLEDGGLGERLADAAYQFGDRSVYLGDDGLVYLG